MDDNAQHFGAQPVGEGCGGWPVAEGCGPQLVHSTLLMSGSRSSYTFLVESNIFSYSPGSGEFLAARRLSKLATDIMHDIPQHHYNY